jgi:leucyl aminopeptidase
MIAPAIGLVGKGVTFDSGGYSIKTPSVHMETMKSDMSGAALVLGIMRAAAQLNLQRNLVGCIACVENMISGNSYRPGDVLTSLSGKTVEVLNTDAEGRLILADALTYIQSKFQLECLIDFATLTGAIVVALGELMPGLFCNDEGLCVFLQKAGEETGEPVWRMPLAEEYDRSIDSDIADMKNISSGYGAGSIIGAQFLQRFIKENTRWAHLDIAGVAYTKSGNAFAPKNGSGACLRMMLRFLGA